MRQGGHRLRCSARQRASQETAPTLLCQLRAAIAPHETPSHRPFQHVLNRHSIYEADSDWIVEQPLPDPLRCTSRALTPPRMLRFPCMLIACISSSSSQTVCISTTPSVLTQCMLPGPGCTENCACAPGADSARARAMCDTALRTQSQPFAQAELVPACWGTTG
jgi:hypothetical protein